ncbi:MAG: bifunctional phosphoglucose/phosphomannose isomerase [Saprospiraceae bacterium]
MENLIYKFMQQMEEAMILAENSKIQNFQANKVFITGMGGSGIAGKFSAEIMQKYGNIPVFVSNTYDIPSWIDEQTLCLVSSYSGNTEETLSCFEKLLNTNAKIIAITSGGKLLQEAKRLNIENLVVPGDWPAPRACIGYSLIYQLFILFKLNLLNLELPREISLSIDFLLKNCGEIQSEAKKIATLLGNKTPLIYSDQTFEPLAVRFRQQINENSKMLAFSSVFPEMNHNEIAAWVNDYSSFSCIFIKSDLYSPQVLKRMEVSKEIMIKHTDTIIDINSKGYTFLQQLFYLIHLTDWISFYMAEQNDVDAMDISNIDFLKSRLQK